MLKDPSVSSACLTSTQLDSNPVMKWSMLPARITCLSSGLNGVLTISPKGPISGNGHEKKKKAIIYLYTTNYEND